jgi:hypothetical protein
MDDSHVTYVWLALALAVLLSLLLLAESLLRERGSALRGWRAAVLVALCVLAGLAIIIHRVAS